MYEYANILLEKTAADKRQAGLFLRRSFIAAAAVVTVAVLAVGAWTYRQTVKKQQRADRNDAFMGVQVIEKHIQPNGKIKVGPLSGKKCNPDYNGASAAQEVCASATIIESPDPAKNLDGTGEILLTDNNGSAIKKPVIIHPACDTPANESSDVSSPPKAIYEIHVGGNSFTIPIPGPNQGQYRPCSLGNG